MITFFREMWEDDVIGKVISIVVAATFLFILALIGGCIHNEMNHLDRGRVINKQYSAEYYYWQSMGKGGYMQYVPDSYHITITDGQKKYTTSITSEEYRQITVGDEYRRSEK